MNLCNHCRTTLGGGNEHEGCSIVSVTQRSSKEKGKEKPGKENNGCGYYPHLHNVYFDDYSEARDTLQIETFRVISNHTSPQHLLVGTHPRTCAKRL